MAKNEWMLKWARLKKMMRHSKMMEILTGKLSDFSIFHNSKSMRVIYIMRG